MNGMEHKGGPYKTPDYPNLEERVKQLEEDCKTLKKDHSEMRYVAKNYKYSSQLTAWGPRWAAAGLYVFIWFTFIVTVASVLEIKSCSDSNSRLERAVRECDCDYLRRAHKSKTKK